MDTNTPQGTKKSKTHLLVLIVGLLVLAGAGFYVTKHNEGMLSGQMDETAAVSTEQAPEAAPAETAAVPAATIDVNAALSDRILGSTSAPVKISEHASLTCSHCGDFHRNIFQKIKTDYIDTGKAYLVFSDFPLNAPAMHASMVARCLPEDKYFGFIQMLFEEQEKWAYDESYLDFLKAESAENGLDEAHFQACIQNKELQEGIINRMKAVQQQWNISSTPSFVINNKSTYSGGLPVEEFAKILDEAAAAPAPAPAATPETAPAPEAAPVPEVATPDDSGEAEDTGESVEPAPVTPAPEESGVAE